ncbi:MAG: hypothetical protein K6D38_05860 [Pseudobutyrivibrio sp.]|nr:hypothetical protein [Pseudobutyrivibrio sp.]
MSQEKVDQKKYDKTHRRALVRKKKIEEFLSLACVLVITVAVFGWVGYSIYSKASKDDEANKTYEYHDIDTSAITDYISSLDTTAE